MVSIHSWPRICGGCTLAPCEPTVNDLIANVADLMLADLDDLGAEMDAAVVLLIPEFGADAAILQEVSAATGPTPSASSLSGRRDDGA